MNNIIGQLETDFGQYKACLSTLFTLTTTDEARRTVYESVLATEEFVNGIEDKRVQELYKRVVEDFRASISRAILDSDYRAFYQAVFNRANAVEQAIDKHIAALKSPATP